jgi:alkylation response protein AidB-like acyl-CoA dehydrogenase
VVSLTDAAGQALDPVSDAPERAELRRGVRRLIEDVSPEHRVHALDESETFDGDLFRALADMGVLGIGLNGAGDVRDQLVVLEELGAGPTSMAAFLIAQYAVAQVLQRYGSSPAHRRALERLLAGQGSGSFALSEPDGGTDVARVMQTTAVPDGEGGFVLGGHKMWTSGAVEADWIVVLARTSPIEGSPVNGVTMFFVEQDAPGVEITTIDTMGIHGMSTCHVYLSEVRVSAENVLGEVGKGMRQAFATVNREGLHAAAASIGVGRGALSLSVAYARERKVFDKAIASFQVPQHWLVDGAVALESARSLMARAAEVEAGGGDAGNLASMAKLVASEAAVEIALRGMQLMGAWASPEKWQCSVSFGIAAFGAFRPLPTRWCATASAHDCGDSPGLSDPTVSIMESSLS